jgi:hypothetical protein
MGYSIILGFQILHRKPHELANPRVDMASIVLHLAFRKLAVTRVAKGKGCRPYWQIPLPVVG